MPRSTPWLYELGAAPYRWCTAQAGWQASCTRLAAHVPIDARHVLDLGCGPGPVIAAVAAARPAAVIWGLDLASAMLREARQRQPPGGRVGLLRADAVALPFPAAVFDAVTSHSFLYLVSDREAVLKEAWRVLRPGGRLLLVEPSAGRVRISAVLRHSRAPRFLASVALWWAFSRFRGRYRAADLAALLRARGFVVPRGAIVLGGMAIFASAEKPAGAA